jgi:nicotinamidase-related amidase
VGFPAPLPVRFEFDSQEGSAAMTPFPRATALIVIDVQQAFLDPRWGERNNPDAETNIARLLAAWRSTRRSIRHIVHDSTEPDSLLRPGSPGNEIQAAAPEPGEMVYRKV